MQVVIIGGGHAGGSVAANLRQIGFEGSITIVGAETSAPYQRPPLSKAWLQGKADIDSLILKPASWYDEHDCRLLLGVSASAIDRRERSVTLSTGEVLDYDYLVLATGARARKLDIPGAGLGGLLELRTVEDAEQLRQLLAPGKRLAIVGGGYVGLEVAASARQLGVEVVILEREPRCLARVACEPLSSFFRSHHESHGVTFEMDAEIVGFEGDSSIAAVALGDGRHVACDYALIGVGAVPNDELARAAGLECSNGIVVTAEARTADPAIFAIGDVTHRPIAIYDQSLRLESVPNALEQAKQAAAAIANRPQPAPEVPWFWSDQYDLKLQIAGIPLQCDSIIVRGDPNSSRFAIFHLARGEVRAVEAVNAPTEFILGKRMIAARQMPPPAALADPTISMKELAA